MINQILIELLVITSVCIYFWAVPEATKIATHENFEQSQADENLGRQSSIQSPENLSN
jgi:hypothetical protein